MFSIFKKNPKQKLIKEYEATLESAMQAQRNGDIKTYSELTDKAQDILDQLDRLPDA